MYKIRIPQYAKNQAKLGILERKTNKAGLTKEEAKEYNVFSGVERAKQLVANKFVSYKSAQSIARFYARFRNCKTPKCETALKLWGGRRFGKFLYNLIYGVQNDKTNR